MLEKNVSDCSLSDSVKLTGSTKKILKFSECFNIMNVCEFLFEGLPIVLIDALSFQHPIVAFDCDTGPKNLIDVNKSELPVKPENVYQLLELRSN
jgi:glycosyltransferase involved in cell wall biosynthesis